jgi:5-oxoprolinase (ATP-hydrolysing)
MQKHTQNQAADRWQFWIDRGGTFTDLVARTPDGSLKTHKLLSENPEVYQDASIQGIRDLLSLKAGEAISSQKIKVVKMGTTVVSRCASHCVSIPPSLVRPAYRAAGITL